jgi:hypothetical protein
LLLDHLGAHLAVDQYFIIAANFCECGEGEGNFIEKIQIVDQGVICNIQNSDAFRSLRERQQRGHAWKLIFGEIDHLQLGKGVQTGAIVYFKRGEVGDDVVAEVEDLDIAEDVQLDDGELRQLAARLAELLFALLGNLLPSGVAHLFLLSNYLNIQLKLLSWLSHQKG